MKIGIRTSTAVLGIILVFGNALIAPSHGAENIKDPNQGWVVPDNTTVLGSQNGYFGERSSEDRDYSALLDTSKLGSDQEDPTCASLDDPKCSAAQNFIYYAQLPVCQVATDINCIDAISATDSQGKIYPGSFLRYFPELAQNQFEGNPSVNLPSGGSASLFTIPGAEGLSGNTYFASFVMSGGIQKGSSATLGSIHSRIFPVQLQTRQYSFPFCLSENKLCNTGWNKLSTVDAGFKWGESGSGGLSCAESSVGENLCAEKQSFPTNYRFAIKVRLSIAPAGWMHGRMYSPEITIEKSGTNTLLTVSANPIGVPSIYKHFMWSEMPAALRDRYDPNTGKFIGSGGEGWSNSIVKSTDYNQRAWTTAPSPYSPTAIDELNLWLPYADDKATVVPQFWSFRSLTQRELQSANKCFANPSQLNGIVTTNATAYSPGPPVFDKVAGDLNYRVAAPHFISNGVDTFKGTYDLVMRAEVARCIYGFSNAPIKATISIVSKDGSPQVATTSVTEKAGWLRLSANNFEFSSPVVKVSLKQDVVVATKSSITCVKGKIIRKVVAIKPVCPKGYKKR